MQNKRLMKKDYFQFLVVSLVVVSFYYLFFLTQLHQKIFNGRIAPTDIDLFSNTEYLTYCLLALVLIFFLTLVSAVGFFELKEKTLQFNPNESLSTMIERRKDEVAKHLSLLTIFLSIIIVISCALMFENAVVKGYIIFSSLMFFTTHLYLIYFWTKGKTKETIVATETQNLKGEKMGYTQSERTEYKKSARRIANLLGDDFSEIEKEGLDLQTDHFKGYAQEGQKRLVETLEKNNFSLAQLNKKGTSSPEKPEIHQGSKEEEKNNEHY